jgi:hypothetical protein
MTEHRANLSVTDLQGYVLQPKPDQPSFSFEKHCRICYEGETSSNSLISPCRCNGTGRLVHEECLKTWIIARAEDISSGSCEICLAEYLMEIEIVTICNAKGKICLSKSAIKFWGLVIFLCGLVASVGALAGVIDKDDDMEVYLIVLLVASVVSAFIVSYLLFMSAKQAFCVQRMTNWTVMNYSGNRTDVVPNRHELTIFDESDNSAQYAKNYDQSTLILIPETITVHGRSMATPQLRPSLQDISSQTRGMKAFATRSLASSLAPSMNPSPRSAQSFSRI